MSVGQSTARAEHNCIKMGDLRFVGIRGYAVEVPGVGENKLTQEQGVRIIEGTSDAITGEQAAKFQEKAKSYAEKYNRLLLDYLKKQNPERWKVRNQ